MKRTTMVLPSTSQPTAPAEVHRRVEQAQAEMTPGLIGAIPAAAQEAARTTGLCTPEQADRIANGMIAELSRPQLNPEVTRALAQLEVDKQAAKDAGLWDANYERMQNTLGDMFREANAVDPVLEVCIGAMVTSIAKDHGLRVVRANENAAMDGEIVIWWDSALVILPLGIKAMDALDQLRAALNAKAGK